MKCPGLAPPGSEKQSKDGWTKGPPCLSSADPELNVGWLHSWPAVATSDRGQGRRCWWTGPSPGTMGAESAAFSAAHPPTMPPTSTNPCHIQGRAHAHLEGPPSPPSWSQPTLIHVQPHPFPREVSGGHTPLL